MAGKMAVHVATVFSSSRLSGLMLKQSKDIESPLTYVYATNTMIWANPANFAKESIQYRVKWENSDELTWEPEENLRYDGTGSQDQDKTLTTSKCAELRFRKLLCNTIEASAGTKMVSGEKGNSAGEHLGDERQRIHAKKPASKRQRWNKPQSCTRCWVPGRARFGQ